MTKEFSKCGEVGVGGFILEDAGSGSIGIGATADVVITPPEGQRVILDQLYTINTVQTNITTVTVGDREVLSGALGPSNLGTERIKIGPHFNGGYSGPTTIQGEIGEAITISTDVAVSPYSSKYSYAIGR